MANRFVNNGYWWPMVDNQWPMIATAFGNYYCIQQPYYIGFATKLTTCYDMSYLLLSSWKHTCSRLTNASQGWWTKICPAKIVRSLLKNEQPWEPAILGLGNRLHNSSHSYIVVDLDISEINRPSIVFQVLLQAVHTRAGEARECSFVDQLGIVAAPSNEQTSQVELPLKGFTSYI